MLKQKQTQSYADVKRVIKTNLKVGATTALLVSGVNTVISRTEIQTDFVNDNGVTLRLTKLRPNFTERFELLYPEDLDGYDPVSFDGIDVDDFNWLLKRWKSKRELSRVIQFERHNTYTTRPWDEVDYIKVVVRKPNELTVEREYLVIMIEEQEDLNPLGSLT